MSGSRGGRASPRSALYQRLISPALPRRCKYEPDVLARTPHRRSGGTAYCAGSFSPAGACCAATPAATAAIDPVEAQRLFRHAASARRLTSMTSVLANIFQPMIDVFDAVLVFFHDTVGLSWGMSIIALTVTVRALLIPLTLKQFKSMQSLQQLAPADQGAAGEVQGRQAAPQPGDDALLPGEQGQPVRVVPARWSLQLPVFFSLFYMLRKDLRVDICGPDREAVQRRSRQGNWGEGFLFIPDITDSATGGVLVVLLVLYVGSQLLSSVLMSVTADRNQRMLMIALPFVFVPFITALPGGPDPLLDHDEPLDGRPADVHPAQGGDAASASEASRRRRHRRRGKGRDRERDGKGETEAVSGKRDTNGATAERRDEREGAATARERPAAAASAAAQEEEARGAAADGRADRPERARELVELVAGALGFSGRSTWRSTTRTSSRRSHGEDLGLFIGRHGQTIDAVQHLAYRVALDAGLRAGASPSTPRATAHADGRRSSARPRTPPTRP